MYWIEWMLWYIQTSPREVEQWQEKLKKILAIKKTDKKKGKRTEILDRVSETPSAEGSIYEFNENYIELQAGESQERRGLITYISVAIICCSYKAASIALVLNTV